MADATISVGGVFPVGTVVDAYENPSGLVPSGLPPGVAVASATVNASGQLAYTGLIAVVHLATAVVSNARRYITFTPRATVAELAAETDVAYDVEVTAAIDALEARLPIDVRDYGAVFDNSTDDTVAIQAALDAAVTPSFAGASGNDLAGRIVQLPPGRARVDGTLTIPANVQLRGHGPSATYIARNIGGLAANPLVQISPAGVQQMISDCGFICQDQDVDVLAVAGGASPSILADTRVVVRDVVLVGGRDGLSSDFNEGQGNELRLSRVTTVRTARHGFNITTSDAEIQGCTAAAAGTGGVYENVYGFALNTNNSRIHGCKAYGQLAPSGAGFGIGARNQVSACEAQDCQAVGFSVEHDTVLTACTADSCGEEGFALSNGAILVGCIALNRGGQYTMPRAFRSGVGSTDFHIRGLYVSPNNGGVAKIYENDTANVPAGATLDIGNRFGSQVLAYAATITPDPWKGQDVFVGALTGNVTIANPATSPFGDSCVYQPGMKLTFQLAQDATGGRTVTFGAKYKTTGALGTTADSSTTITFVYDGAFWREATRATT